MNWAMRLDCSKAHLEGSQHRDSDLGVATFLKRSCDNLALAGDAFLAFGDELIDLS
jgi:hypothetical protein